MSKKTNERLDGIDASLEDVHAKLDILTIGIAQALGWQLPLVVKEADLSWADPTNEFVIDKAIDEEQVIGFHYTDAWGDPSVRIVSPYELAHTVPGLRVLGYDHGRDALRQFALDRIENLTVLDALDYKQPVIAEDGSFTVETERTVR